MGGTKRISRSTKKHEKIALTKANRESKEEKEALVIHNYNKTGVHNCPHKDAGKTHVHRTRCFKLKHCGYCPVCGNIVSWTQGCKGHGLKGTRLLSKHPTDEQKKIYLVLLREAGDDDDDDIKGRTVALSTKKRKKD